MAKFLTIKSASALFNKSPITIRRLIKHIRATETNTPDIQMVIVGRTKDKKRLFIYKISEERLLKEYRQSPIVPTQDNEQLEAKDRPKDKQMDRAGDSQFLQGIINKQMDTIKELIRGLDEERVLNAQLQRKLLKEPDKNE